MRRILAVLLRDYRHVATNVIALLVCVGLAIMPSLYAWFNIAGGWDPYANTGELKVAVANSDEGVEGSIVPYRINVGERVVSTLAESTKIGYVITSEDDAIDGVSSGEYYAAVVVPKDFSAKLLSVLTTNPTHPQFDYYVNEKRNAIASIVTGKASNSVQTMIDEGLTEAVSDVSTELMDDLSDLLDDDSLLSVASAFDGVLGDSLGALRRSASDIDAYKGVVTSIRGVADASASLMGSSSTSLDAAKLLLEAADGVRELEAAANTAKDGASSAIDAGKGSLAQVESALDDAFGVADGKVDEMVAALGKVDEVVGARRDELQSLRDEVVGLATKIESLSKDVETDKVQYTRAVSVDISDLLKRIDNALAAMDDLRATGAQTVSDIQDSKADVATSRSELKALVAKAQDDLDAVRDTYQDKLSDSLDELASSINDAAADASNVGDRLHGQVDRLVPLMGDASTGLGGLEDTLDKASDKINAAADELQDLHDRLKEAVSSGDMDLVRTIFSADPDALVSFFAAPVELEREAVYAIENNGSAMAPYYTTMALWVGGTLMGVLLYASISKEAMEETGAKPRHAYFGRLLFFLTIGALQSTILLLGDLFFLGIQCEEPLLFMLTGWLASMVFINIIFALSSSFGDVGKAIGVLLMVVQVAGSGGTFPVQMLPPLFQSLYRFLPFVYSENAMREAICGVYGDHWLVAVGTLALYLVPALLLGLVLSKPFAPVNEWVEERLEETRLM